jgi:rhamnogalacturonyl hydrolase YesR
VCRSPRGRVVQSAMMACVVWAPGLVRRRVVVAHASSSAETSGGASRWPALRRAAASGRTSTSRNQIPRRCWYALFSKTTQLDAADALKTSRAVCKVLCRNHVARMILRLPQGSLKRLFGEPTCRHTVRMLWTLEMEHQQVRAQCAIHI